jgi:hypothetical protein
MNIVCAFTKNNLTILYVVGSNNAVVDNSQVQLASTSGQMIVYQTSYEELKLNNFNLSKIKVSDDSDVLVFVNNIINNLTKNIIKNNAVILVIILLIYNIISYLLTILFITILEKIFYHGFKISFKKTFKIVLLCSAPYVLGVLLAQTTGISIFEILGILIMIVYVMKTIFSYKLRYGGGIPINNIKGFKINEEQKNNNIFDGTSEDVDENRGEEGKDDNEL